MKVITIGNQKGGVGKSTLTANLAIKAASTGKKVLIIDADAQGSSLAFRALRQQLEVKGNEISCVSITAPTIHDDIANFDNFDEVYIDLGGRVTDVFRSGLVASDLFLIACLPSVYDIWSAEDTFKVLKEARTYKKNIPAYVVLNQVIPNPRSIVSRDALDALKEFADQAKLLNTLIYNRSAYKASIARGKGVVEYEPKGTAAAEISNLYNEIQEILYGGGKA